MLKKPCKWVCRQFGQPECNWRDVRLAFIVWPLVGAGLGAAYCLVAWLF